MNWMRHFADYCLREELILGRQPGHWLAELEGYNGA